MKNMTEKFLEVKHWKLFLLTCVLPFMMIADSLFFNPKSGNNSDPDFIINSMYFLLTIIYMGVYYGWFWSVAIKLQSKVPDGVNMKVKKFKILFFSQFISIPLSSNFSSVLSINDVGAFPVEISINPIIPLLYYFSVFCKFYIWYFLAKTLKTVEQQREVNFLDFVGEFLLIWFYPIGVWIVQPKINKINEK